MDAVAAIILAAGKGTRMQSSRAKVLHEICGIAMVRYVVETVLCVVKDVVVVVGHQADAVRDVLAAYRGLRFALQEQQLGTGHAVMTGLSMVPAGTHDVVILCGDTPLIRRKTLEELVGEHRASKRSVTLLATRLEKPYGYGRIVSNPDGDVLGIVEEADASDAQKRITTINSGTYCVHLDFLRSVLPDLKRDNAQGEFYITDVVAEAYRKGVPAFVMEVCDPIEVLGVNTKADLELAERTVKEVIASDRQNPLDFCRLG
jgi:UDP-N-acetylglucosamine diphosphorylase/glucosamine-1-phosphate N-acetyltransferase